MSKKVHKKKAKKKRVIEMQLCLQGNTGQCGPSRSHKTSKLPKPGTPPAEVTTPYKMKNTRSC